MEQVVVRDLLRLVPKGHVGQIWEEIRGHLHGALVAEDVLVVWDPTDRRVHITADLVVLRDAVCNGRPVQVLGLGSMVAEARGVYRREIAARRRTMEAKKERGRREPQARRTGDHGA